MAAIAESVASGKLLDASLEFCSDPLSVEEGGNEETNIEMRLGGAEKTSVKERKRSKRTHKTAPVDQGDVVIV